MCLNISGWWRFNVYFDLLKGYYFYFKNKFEKRIVVYFYYRKGCFGKNNPGPPESLIY